MVESVTLHYGWIKPEVQHSPTTWGGYLNDDLDAIDALIYAGQQAIVPIGAVTMFAGVALPPNWLWCNGGVYSITDIPLLAPIMRNVFPGGDGVTTTAVPNLWSGRTPVGYDGGGWSMGASGGEYNHTLGWGEMPVHNHGVSDPGHAHGVYDPTHIHGVGDPGHIHSVWLGDPGHAHNITTGNHAHGVLAHAHSGSLMRFVGGSGQPLGIHGGVEANVTYGNTDANGASTDTAGNLGGTTDWRGTGMSVAMNAVGTGVYLGYSGTGIGIYGAVTSVSVGTAGSGGAHNNMQPYTVIGFIIRYR